MFAHVLETDRKLEKRVAIASSHSFFPFALRTSERTGGWEFFIIRKFVRISPSEIGRTDSKTFAFSFCLFVRARWRSWQIQEILTRDLSHALKRTRRTPTIRWVSHRVVTHVFFFLSIIFYYYRFRLNGKSKWNDSKKSSNRSFFLDHRDPGFSARIFTWRMKIQEGHIERLVLLISGNNWAYTHTNFR